MSSSFLQLPPSSSAGSSESEVRWGVFKLDAKIEFDDEIFEYEYTECMDFEDLPLRCMELSNPRRTPRLLAPACVSRLAILCLCARRGFCHRCLHVSAGSNLNQHQVDPERRRLHQLLQACAARRSRRGFACAI